MLRYATCLACWPPRCAGQAGVALPALLRPCGVWRHICLLACPTACLPAQFLFTLAYTRGIHISASKLIWSNLIPATLGNYVGGGLFLAGAYAFAYGGTPKRMGDYYDEKVAPKMPWAKKRD